MGGFGSRNEPWRDMPVERDKRGRFSSEKNQSPFVLPGQVLKITILRDKKWTIISSEFDLCEGSGVFYALVAQASPILQPSSIDGLMVLFAPSTGTHFLDFQEYEKLVECHLHSLEMYAENRTHLLSLNLSFDGKPLENTSCPVKVEVL